MQQESRTLWETAGPFLLSCHYATTIDTVKVKTLLSPLEKKNAHKQGALISRPKHPFTLRWGTSPRTAMYKLLLGAGATITEDGERIHRKKDR